MTHRETVQHNSKHLLRLCRGKTKQERQTIYAVFAGGPMVLLLSILPQIHKAMGQH